MSHFTTLWKRLLEKNDLSFQKSILYDAAAGLGTKIQMRYF